ncbi:MAG TPA: transglutaminase-like domain-containing protein, partial [Fimbriimonadaceae bacterium]|nr:transglutaminase-like domain-containing protein [Fimbriimonadaceae bacterium]
TSMARWVGLWLVLLLLGSARAEESYLGLFVNDQRIGFVSSLTQNETIGGKTLIRTDSTTVIQAGLLGDALSLRIYSQSWNDAKGNPQLMKFSVESGGRSQRTEATFTETQIHVVIDNNGAITSKKVSIPKDAKVVDDAVNSLLEDGVIAGSERVYYVLDPMTSTLIKNTARLAGPRKVTVRGKDFDATLIEVVEPRATTKVYVSAKGDLIKAEALAGISMIPISKEEALSDAPANARIDLATMTKIPVDKPLGDLDGLARVNLSFVGANLSRAPSDLHQTIKGSNKNWNVDLHPAVADPKIAVSIAKAAKQKPEWLKPGLNIPSGSSQFKTLAKRVVGGAPNVVEGANRIQKHVHGLMRPNAGIGVLRDASEVLKTKEGVCRDYAILTATLLRAANIPARLASGLVYQAGDFYYHAWAEYWDGKRWLGLDSTRPSGKVTAGHLKLADGSVEEAFLFTFLESPQVQVLNVKRKAGATR